MGDPREDLTLLELENQGIPRIRVTPQPPPQQVYDPPPGHVGEWPRGTTYREVPPEPSLPPMQGRAPLEPDLSPANQWQPPRTPWQDAQAIGGLVKQGVNRFLAGPPAENRQRFEGPYTAPQAVGQGAGAVIGALVDPARQAVESQQVRSDLNADPLTQEQARQAGPGAAAEVGMNLMGVGATIPARTNAAGMFVPVRNPQKIAKAEALEQAGAPPEQVWRMAQAVRGKDNILREEISDAGARFTGADQESIARRIFERENPNLDWNGRGSAVENAKSNARYVAHAKLTNLPGHQLRYEDVMDHPELFNHPAIQELRKQGVDIRKTPVTEDPLMLAKGQYHGQSREKPQGQIDYRVADEDLPRKTRLGLTTKGNLERGDTFKTMLHETEHHLANIFGMAKGHSGNPASIAYSPVAAKIYENQMKQAPRIMSEAEHAAGQKTMPPMYQKTYAAYVEGAKKDLAKFELQARLFAADEAYRLSHGEGWANLIARQRADMSAKQRAAVFPGSQMYPRMEQHKVEFNDPWVFGFGSPSAIKVANAEAQAARSIPIRDAGAKVGSESVSGLTKPDHVYRGMTADEFNATIGAGKGVRSRQDFSTRGEGTSWAKDAETAESYVNFGRDDPRVTNKPTYLVEAKGGEGFTLTRDGYFKSDNEISRDRIARVIEMRREGDRIVGREIPISARTEAQASRDPNKRLPSRGASAGAHGYSGPRMPPGTRAVPENWQPVKPTVLDPQRSGTGFPDVYRNPRLIAEQAAGNVAAEHPALKELFGVTRADLYDISQQGRRPGNMEPNLFMPKTPGTSYAAANLQTPQNEQRILDTLGEGLKHRGLREGMVPWYVMDPMFQHMVKLVGKDQAIKDYTRMNAIVPPFSASNDVLSEINRGTAANMYAKRRDYDTFHRFGGMRPGVQAPPDMAGVGGHAYHAVQSDPVVRWLATGQHGYNKDTVKIPTYAAASGVPETGFQTRWAVPDAHIARGSGMAETRRGASYGDYMGGAEYRTFAPWYREKIAKPLNLEAVPTQALQWGTFSKATGVDTPIGAGKLELFSQRIWERALQLRIDPKVLRDAVLQGDAHALRIIGIGGGAGAAGMGSLVDPSRYQEYRQ